jgi:hypothetical protein
VRWIGSCRRELLDHITKLNEEHLRRLIRDYVRYYHEDRIHDSLGKDSMPLGATCIDGGARPGGSEIRLASAGRVLSRRTADLGCHRGRIPSLPDVVPRVRPGRLRRPLDFGASAQER